MNKEETIFNPEMPYAHYEKCRGIYEQYKKITTFGTIMPIPSLIIGFLCVIPSPLAMAVFFLMAVPFLLFCIIGCQARREKMCLFSTPLALIAAVTTLVAGSPISILGLIMYIVSAVGAFKAAHAIAHFMALKNLPGFPLFDASLDDITFAAMDRLGSEEFIDESVLYEEVRGERFIAPMEPSEDMEEIVTTGMAITEEEKQLTAYERETVKEVSDVPEDLRDEVAQSLGHLAPNLAEYEEAKAKEHEENSDRAYEKMMKVQQGKNNSNISDVDLFG